VCCCLLNAEKLNQSCFLEPKPKDFPKSKRPLVIRLFPCCLITILHQCAKQPTWFAKIQLKRIGKCLSCILYCVQKNSIAFQFSLCSVFDWVWNKIKTTRLLNRLFPGCLITILRQCAKQPTRCDKIQLKRIGKYLCSFFIECKKIQLHSSSVCVYILTEFGTKSKRKDIWIDCSLAV